MLVEFEDKDELNRVTDVFSAKEDLAEVTAAMQASDIAASPIEVAALQLTMRQIDNTMDLPCNEGYQINPLLYPSLATEGLKENIGNKWNAFASGLKKIFTRMAKFCNDAFVKFTKLFKRKPKTNAEPVNEPVKIKVPKKLISWEGDVSTNAFIHRITLANKAFNVILSGSSTFSLINCMYLAFIPDFEKELEDRRNLIKNELTQNLETTEKGNTITASIGDGTDLVLETNSSTVLPILVIEDLGEVELEFTPEEAKEFFSKSIGPTKELLMMISKLTRDQTDNLKVMGKLGELESDEAKVHMMRMQPIISRLSNLLATSIGYAGKLFDLRDKIVQASDNKQTTQEETA